MSVRAKLDEIGLVGERRALTVLLFSFFAIVYFLVALADDSGWGRAFGGLAACYGLAVFGLAAGWFWARWFAGGIAWSGLMMGVLALVMAGWNPVVAIYLGTHGAAVLCLGGRKMAEAYDLQPAWRERFQLDEHGVIRVRRAITRAAAALPSLIVWALAPRGEAAVAALTIVGALGLLALIRLRTAGVLLCGASAAGALAVALGHLGDATALRVHGIGGPPLFALGLLAGAALLGACLPFVRPIARYLVRR